MTRSDASGKHGHTDDEAFHLFFPKNVDVQGLLQLVVELVGAPSGGHDAQFIPSRTVALFMLLLQLANEIDADVNPVGFEVEEVQATAIIFGIQLARKVDKLSKRSTDLETRKIKVSCGDPGVFGVCSRLR